MTNMTGVWAAAMSVGLAVVCSFADALAADPPAGGGGGGPVGIFENHGDVGSLLHPGDVQFDPAKQTYTVSGSGVNMWFAADAFHFAWKQVSGDVALEADVAFVGEGKNPHRKACLLVRQNLEPGSVYADVAVHGAGLTSLQYRRAQAELTHEVQANVLSPRRVRIEKRGQYIYMFTSSSGDGPLQLAGTSGRLTFAEPYYVGLGVCSHDADVVETAVFSNVKLTPLATAGEQMRPFSTLETLTVSSTDRQVRYVSATHIEAPNWTPDGKSLIFNGNGRLHRIALDRGTPETIDTGFAVHCNNDHGISPDGRLLAISDQSREPHQSMIYTLNIEGGTPQRVTEKSPSYWHGWSPDGKTMAFCGQRDGKFGIFTIPAAGGDETRLTTTEGLDDGPEYSPDGKFIYFNSDRTGSMQIWRMRPDGGEPTQVTHDEFNNWFAHPSPDGKSIVFLSYAKDVKGHPAEKEITLRLMSLATGKITVLAEIFGGQGTMNVPSWSPDGKQVAFVSYQRLP